MGNKIQKLVVCLAIVAGTGIVLFESQVFAGWFCTLIGAGPAKVCEGLYADVDDCREDVGPTHCSVTGGACNTCCTTAVCY